MTHQPTTNNVNTRDPTGSKNHYIKAEEAAAKKAAEEVAAKKAAHGGQVAHGERMEDAANEKAEDAETAAEGINETEETIVLSDEEEDLLENFRQSQAANLAKVKRPIFNCRCTPTRKCGKCSEYARAKEELSRAYARIQHLDC